MVPWFLVPIASPFHCFLRDLKIFPEYIYNISNQVFSFLPGDPPPGVMGPLLASGLQACGRALACQCSCWNSLHLSPELYSVFLRSHVSVFPFLLVASVFWEWSVGGKILDSLNVSISIPLDLALDG